MKNNLKSLVRTSEIADGLVKALTSKSYILNPRRAGQITVEALVAISVLVFGFLGAFALLSRSFFFNRVATDDYIASYLAAEGIEVAKNIIDSNYIARLTDPLRLWNDGFADGDFEVEYGSLSLAPISSCSDARLLSLDPLGNFYNYSGSTATPFSRCVRVALLNPGEMRVNSIVAWQTGSIQKNVNLEDRFFDWRP